MALKAYIFNPDTGTATVATGPDLDRYARAGEVVVCDDSHARRMAPFYGGKTAFKALSVRQSKALGKALGYEGEAPALLPWLHSLPTVTVRNALGSL